MNIALVGSEADAGICQFFRRACMALGETATVIDDEGMYRAIRGSTVRGMHRFFGRMLAGKIQEKIVEGVVEAKPDLILVFKGWFLEPETLLTLKRLFPQAPLCNFNTDNPFNTRSHASTNAWIRSSIPLYDRYFIWGRFLLDPVREAGGKEVKYLPFGYDPSYHLPSQVSSDEMGTYGSDIAFIGTWDREREGFLSKLTGYDLAIWGSGWNRAARSMRRSWRGRSVYGEEFSKVCNASKIVLNHVRAQNVPAHNMKTFEIPACGGFMMATDTPEQRGFFEAGEEAEYFSSMGELEEKIGFYLARDNERKTVAERGRHRVLGSDYSYVDRMRAIMEA